MVIFVIGNIETTQTARVFTGTTAVEAAKEALKALPYPVVKTGQFFQSLDVPRDDSVAWALIDSHRP